MTANAFPWGTPQVEVIEFHGDRLEVIPGTTVEATLFLPSTVAENLGVDWSSQLQRIKRDEELAATMVVITIQGRDGKQGRQVIAMPLDVLPVFLYTIGHRRVTKNPEKLKLYRRECFTTIRAVLAAKFLGPNSTAHDQMLIADVLPPKLPLEGPTTAREAELTLENLKRDAQIEGRDVVHLLLDEISRARDQIIMALREYGLTLAQFGLDAAAFRDTMTWLQRVYALSNRVALRQDILIMLLQLATATGEKRDCLARQLRNLTMRAKPPRIDADQQMGFAF
jgi:hypothetical protein